MTLSPSGDTLRRTDILGFFRMRYSDDGGRSWSKDHWRVPLRRTRIDEHNVPFDGKVTMQWCVDKGIVTDDGGALAAFTKVGTFVSSPPEEVFLLYGLVLLLLVLLLAVALQRVLALVRRAELDLAVLRGLFAGAEHRGAPGGGNDDDGGVWHRARSQRRRHHRCAELTVPSPQDDAL